jgi:hypothetical protein
MRGLNAVNLGLSPRDTRLLDARLAFRDGQVRVRLHPGAATDLTSAGDWYELQLSGLGASLTDEVDHALDAIGERPMTWPLWPGIGEAVGVRRFLLARFPFAIGYIVEGTAHRDRRSPRCTPESPPGLLLDSKSR